MLIRSGKTLNAVWHLLLVASTFTPTLAIAQMSNSMPGRMQSLLNSIDSIRQQEKIAAVGIALINPDGTIWTGGLGTLGHDSTEPVTANTIFRVGSITKSFNGLAALKLADELKLDLDDEISEWVPRRLYDNPWEKLKPITLAQLLEHTAGFRDISREEFQYRDSEMLPVVDTLTRFEATHKALWRPGVHSSYSNLGAAYLSHIIEQQEEVRFEQYVEQQIFAPLGMSNSGFFLHEHDRANFALGYDKDGVTPIPYWHMAYRAFGGANSTVKDMGQFVHMLLNRGRHNRAQVFAAESVARMEVPTTTWAARTGLQFGYGLGNYQWLHNGVAFHGHGGDADGYLSRYAYTRRNNSGYFVVITAFKNSVLRRIQRLIQDYLTLDIDPPSFPDAMVLNKDVVQRLTGTYTNATARFSELRSQRMRIFLHEDKLFMRVGDRNRRQLVPVSAEHFRLKHQPVATIAIGQAEDGQIYYQDDANNFVKVD